MATKDVFVSAYVMRGSTRIVQNRTHPVDPFFRHRPGVKTGKKDVPVSGYTMRGSRRVVKNHAHNIRAHTRSRPHYGARRRR